MKRMTFAFVLLFIAGIAVYTAVAQPPGGGRGSDGGAGGPGGPDGFRPPPHPLETALDADGDHQLSAKEIENAVAALKTLDKNENGKIDEDELRPRFAGRPGGPDGGRRGPDGAGGADGPPRDGEARRPGNIEEAVAGILNFDKNEDGKLTKEELPERMQGMIERGDTNGDGALDKEELAKIVATFRGQGQGRGPGEPGAGPEGRGGPAGPPSPEMIVENALRFDADGDGKLGRDELLEFAKQMIQRRGGPGGPEGRGPAGGDRPNERPQRPDAE
jgi:collagen type III alpha